jgi:hypothetical protein
MASLKEWESGKVPLRSDKSFWVIELLNKEGNMVAYLEDVVHADDGFPDTYWTQDIHKALKWSSESEAQGTIDGTLDHVSRGYHKSCKAREHVWMGK